MYNTVGYINVQKF